MDSTDPRSDLGAAEVRRLARLARLELPPPEIEACARDLGAVLEYVARLRALDLDDLAPLAHVGDAEGVADPDEPRAPLPPDALAAIAPRMDGPFLAVPKVLDPEGNA